MLPGGLASCPTGVPGFCARGWCSPWLVFPMGHTPLFGVPQTVAHALAAPLLHRDIRTRGARQVPTVVPARGTHQVPAVVPARYQPWHPTVVSTVVAD